MLKYQLVWLVNGLGLAIEKMVKDLGFEVISENTVYTLCKWSDGLMAYWWMLLAWDLFCSDCWDLKHLCVSRAVKLKVIWIRLFVEEIETLEIIVLSFQQLTFLFSGGGKTMPNWVVKSAHFKSEAEFHNSLLMKSFITLSRTYAFLRISC